MEANFTDKRMSITTMRAKNQAFAIFLTPLISHYPLPLNTREQEIKKDITGKRFLQQKLTK
jgi:hypothetical protein